jgi:signal transduction histidine kinase
VPEALPAATTDRMLLRLVLMNLVSNAIKYTQEGHVIVAIRFEQDAQVHTIQVTDTGCGIPAERHSDIFEPFTQLEPLKRKHTPGVGLGLTLVRESIKALGGRIELKSEVGRGSTFTIVLSRN